MDELRHTALALRDFSETVGLDCTVTYPDGSHLVFSVDDGCHLLTPTGGMLELTDEWLEYAGVLPVEGVESVRGQFVTLAAKRGAGV